MYEGNYKEVILILFRQQHISILLPIMTLLHNIIWEESAFSDLETIKV